MTRLLKTLRSPLALVLAGGLATSTVACGERFEAASTSCRALLQADPDLAGADGVYEVVVTTGSAAASRVWCDMTTDGGGWLLVARSGAADPDGRWGWHGAAGTVDDLTTPYSLGVGELPVTFSELLLADLNEQTGRIASHAYVREAPTDLFTSYRSTGYEFQSLRTVVGGCTPAEDHQGLRLMFAVGGYTSEEDVFFFRDVDRFEPFGLRSYGWGLTADANVPDCDRHGMLNEQPGLIMVR